MIQYFQALNQDLILEGIVRDIVRVIQSMRKKAGFAVEDRINISWDFDGQIQEALGKFEQYLKAETLTNKIMKNIEDCDFSNIVEINDKQYKVELKKDNFLILTKPKEKSFLLLEEYQWILPQ